MARRVFFSFHYERDVLRVGQIRNSGVVTSGAMESTGFIDSASWESVKRQGNDAIRRWIDTQMNGTSVTVVLIGAETADREWVQYEIKASHERGNGLLGVHIHNVVDLNRKTDLQGKNPFDQFQCEQNGRNVLLSSLYPAYDWVQHDGRTNLSTWVEAAARKAGR